MLQMRPILDSDRTTGVTCLIVGADGIGRMATWAGHAWAFAADPTREIHDAEAIGEIDLDECR